MSLIRIEQVSKRYSNNFLALHPTNLTIEPSCFTVILGPSGAGKSTLLRTINGLEQPSTGTITVDGRKLTPASMQRLRAKVGMVFQQFNLVGRLNVMTNVLTGCLYNRPWYTSLLYLFAKKDYELAHWALERVGLIDKAWERADQLSGGQQQRVGIARALAQRPQVILADEPVASLDPLTSEEIMGLLLEICRHEQIAVVASLHQVNLAMRYADRIIGLNKGQVVFDNAPAALTSDMLQTVYQRQAGTTDEDFKLEMAN